MFSMSKPGEIIFYTFALALFAIPLVLWPYTSEVFEFNKIVLVYVLTLTISFLWAVRSIVDKKMIFRHTILDIPLVVFIASQAISTLFSIDQQTSIFGYYSRFNGGLLSTVSYSILYWAFVSNIAKGPAIKLIFWLLASGLVVSVYGILQHFGIDKDVWVQDVQSRIFSTLGQPNWLAAWLAALIPLCWGLAIKSDLRSKIFWGLTVLASILFWTLIFTKSRSGLLGIGVAFAIFWPLVFWVNRGSKKIVQSFLVFVICFIAVGIISGTQWTPSIGQLIHKSESIKPNEISGPALEVGGTESGTIRKIVWKGAIEIWKHYPIFGTGVETFAYSYYGFRPAEHNLVSEWDFIYNKAHNEYLNIAANTGTFGLISYLLYLGFATFQIIIARKAHKEKDKNYDENVFIRFGLFAGFSSLLVTNFFGFSVVPTQMILFLYPAFAVILGSSDQKLAVSKNKKTDLSQKLLVTLLLAPTSYLLIAIFQYWDADINFAKGRDYASIKELSIAENYLHKSIYLEPNQALFHNELAMVYTQMATAFNEQGDVTNTQKYLSMAIEESDKATTLSPANINLKRTKFSIFIMLSAIDRNLITNAGEVMKQAIILAPTDAKLYYNMALIYAQTGQNELALNTLAKTVELKANYKDARLAYAILLSENGQKSEARTQLEYILNNIDPNDSITRQTLESL